MQSIKDEKNGVIVTAADILLRNLPKRMPLTEDMIAAAIVDPSMQHLPVIDNWLDEQKLSKIELLQKIIVKYNIDVSLCRTVTVTHKPTQSEQTDASNEPEETNYRLSLLKKYRSVPRQDKTLGNELLKFSMIQSEISDVLQFWRGHECNFVQLSSIAKVILCKPATSAKSESAFSVAGALVCKRRGSLDPLRITKTLFVHDNYDLLNCDEM